MELAALGDRPGSLSESAASSHSSTWCRAGRPCSASTLAETTGPFGDPQLGAPVAALEAQHRPSARPPPSRAAGRRGRRTRRAAPAARSASGSWPLARRLAERVSFPTLTTSRMKVGVVEEVGGPGRRASAFGPGGPSTTIGRSHWRRRAGAHDRTSSADGSGLAERRRRPRCGAGRATSWAAGFRSEVRVDLAPLALEAVGQSLEAARVGIDEERGSTAGSWKKGGARVPVYGGRANAQIRNPGSKLGHRISACDAPRASILSDAARGTRPFVQSDGSESELTIEGWWLAFASLQFPPLRTASPLGGSRPADPPAMSSPRSPTGPGRALSVDDLVAYFRAGPSPAPVSGSASSRRRSASGEDGRAGPLRGAGRHRGDPGAARGARLRGRRGRTATSSRSSGAAIGSPSSRAASSSSRARALPTAAACRGRAGAHVREVGEVGAPARRPFLGVGARPFGALDEVDWLPKRRYAVMRDYFPRHGRSSRLAHHMMKMTATVQANFDYDGEADAVDKIRTAYGVTSIVTALFAASPIVEGRPSGVQELPRRDLARDRRGSLRPAAVRLRAAGSRFRDYVEWALDVPMFFVVRDGVYRPADGLHVPALPGRGVRGRAGDDRATGRCTCRRCSPRCASSATSRCAAPTPGRCRWPRGWGRCGGACSRTGRPRRAAWALVADHSFAEREALRREVPRAGLGGALRRPLRCASWPSSSAGSRTPAWRGCRAAPGIARCSSRCCAYAEAGRSPADDLLDDFEAARGDPRPSSAVGAAARRRCAARSRGSPRSPAGQAR